MGAAIAILLWAFEGGVAAPHEAPASPAVLVPTAPAAPIALAGLPQTSVRANLLASIFDYVGVGLGVGHSFDRHLAFEASANFVTLSDVDSGFYGEAFARAGHFGARNSVSLGLGPGFLYTPDFGPVAFAVPEIAYELRKRGSASFLAGFGVPVALNQSRDNLCPSSQLLGCLFDRLQYHPGDISLRFRIALGYAF